MAITNLRQPPTPSKFATMVNGVEGSAQTYKAGAILIFSSNTLVVYAGTAQTPCGIAASPASGVANTIVSYYPLLAGHVIEITLDQAGGLGRALVITDLDKEYGITVDSAGIAYLDVDKVESSGEGRMKVIGFISAVGDLSPRVYATPTLDQLSSSISAN